MRLMTKTLLVSLVAALLGATPQADQPRRSFIEVWQGKRVEVRRTLVTLVYSERGRLGVVHRNKRVGLTVATPSANPYLRFAVGDSRQDIVADNPQQVLDRLALSNRRDEPSDGAANPRIEPQMLVRYERGGALVVSGVHIERNRVRLSFDSLTDHTPAEQLATALTIQWPIDLSPALIEAPIIDALIRQFVDLPESPER